MSQSCLKWIPSPKKYCFAILITSAKAFLSNPVGFISLKSIICAKTLQMLVLAAAAVLENAALGRAAGCAGAEGAFPASCHPKRRGEALSLLLS